MPKKWISRIWASVEKAWWCETSSFRAFFVQMRFYLLGVWRMQIGRWISTEPRFWRWRWWQGLLHEGGWAKTTRLVGERDEMLTLKEEPLWHLLDDVTSETSNFAPNSEHQEFIDWVALGINLRQFRGWEICTAFWQCLEVATSPHFGEYYFTIGKTFQPTTIKPQPQALEGLRFGFT